MIKAILSAAMVVSPPQPPPANDDPTPPLSSLSGQEYYQRECAICHGLNGEGTERGSAITRTHKVYGSQVIREGRSGSKTYAIPMPAYSRDELTARQLAEIWQMLGEKPKPDTGAGLYRAYCENCHGSHGSGGDVEVAINHAVGALSLWVRYGGKSQDKDFLSRHDYMPSFNERELTDQDILLIGQYLKGSPIP